MNDRNRTHDEIAEALAANSGILQGPTPLGPGDLAAGDIVEFRPGYSARSGVWKVERALKSNVDLVDEQGAVLRCAPFALMKSTKPFRPVEGPTLVLGAFARFKPRNAGKWGDTLFVLTDNPKNGKVRLAPAGGDGGRWIPGVPLTMLDPVDPKDVLK